MLNVERDGAVLRLTLNRPEVKNALNTELIAALSHELAIEDPAVRVVVIRGSDGSFCAGGDLKMMRDQGSKSNEENEADALLLATLFERIASYPALVISVVEGPCFGGGCGIVAASDLVLSMPDAKFCFSEVKLGLVPATISPYVFPKIGPGQARTLFMTADVFDGVRAEQIGLVHEIMQPSTSGNGIEDLINKRIAAQLKVGPEAVRICKKLTQAAPLSKADSAKLLAEVRSSNEAKEGLTAFLEKRKPGYAV